MCSYTCISSLPCLLLLPDIRTFSAPKWYRIAHAVTLARNYVLLLVTAAITILSELRYEMAALVVTISVIPADHLIDVCSSRQVTLLTVSLHRVEQ